jgi:hypothetical protein
MKEIEGRIVIIPFLHGKLQVDGSISEPDIEAILEQWQARHPEFMDRERDFQIIRGHMFLTDEGIETDLVRVTAAVSEELETYDPTEDADLYEEYLAESDGPPRQPRHKIWMEQCDAAQRIEAEYGGDKALGYLIGEKLLNFLEVAESRPEWRAEIPLFVAEIKEIFERWRIVEYFETTHRLGALGHVADHAEHELLRSQVDASENVREDTRNLLLLEWARQLLTEDEAAS